MPGRLCAAILWVLALALLACRDSRPPLAFSPEKIPEARTGQAYELTVVVTGNQTPVGQIYISEGQLPPGLTLSHQRGDSAAAIGGTPRAAGRYSFTVEAWCLGTNVSGQTGRRVYTLEVK